MIKKLLDVLYWAVGAVIVVSLLTMYALEASA